jgi:hypothetical protein
MAEWLERQYSENLNRKVQSLNRLVIMYLYSHLLTEKFLLSLFVMAKRTCYAYALPLTIASNLFFSKTSTPTNFIFCKHVPWVIAFTFCAQQLHQVHTGHTVCQNVPAKHCLSKSSSPEPKVV